MGEKPHLSYEELYAEAQMYLNEAKHKHEEVLANIFKSSNFIKGIPDDQNQNEAMNDLVYQEYKKAYKLLRKKVYFLLHEDKIPGFDVLPPDIKRRITNLWRELQDFINKDDYRYEPGMLGYHCPDLQRLKNIYHRTCKLRNINPEDFDWDDSNRLAFLISRGTPIESLIELFEKEIKELVEIHLPKIELEKRESMLNKQTQLYKAALNDISEHENFLKIKIEELKSTIEILDNEISGHLKTQVV
jgi:hypothetical protein